MKEVKKEFKNSSVEIISGIIYSNKDVIDEAIQIIKGSNAREIFEHIEQVESLNDKPRVAVIVKVLEKFTFSGELVLSVNNNSSPESIANQIIEAVRIISKEYEVYERKPSDIFWENISKLMNDIDFGN